MEQNEIWKDVPEYGGLYKISNTGKLRSLDKNRLGRNGSYRPIKGKILKVSKNTAGYFRIRLYKNNFSERKFIHRLVAETFIPNLNNKPTVNHINSNKTDNRVENLEWATYSENNKHAFDFGFNRSVKPQLGKLGKLSNSSKPVMQYDVNWNLIKTWDSQACVERGLNIKQNSISYACQSENRKAGGFKWKFLNNK